MTQDNTTTSGEITAAEAGPGEIPKGRPSTGGGNMPTDARHVAAMVARVLWLVRLRWFAAAVLALLGALVGLGLGGMTQGAYLIAWAVVVLLYNFAVWISLSRISPRAHPDISGFLRRISYLQVMADIVVLIAVLHYTGGAMNPLVAMLVFEMAIAASLLSRRDAYIQAAVAGLLYTGLAVLESLANFPLAPMPGLLSESVRRYRLETGASVIVWVLAACAIVIVTMVLTVYLTNAILARLRKINQRLIDANKQLAALDLAKSRFLRISSHQLRSPLAAIHTMLSAIQEVGGFNHKQYELILKIQDRSEEIMAQVDEMMLLSTIKENASETAQLHAIDVGGVLSHSAGAFAEEAAHRGLELKVEDGGPALITAWEDALDTIMEHLLSNALKYTPKGGKVGVSWLIDGHNVDIEVSDTGIGIPQEQQDQLFREFFRATNARQVCCGTGLGLAIVKAIVEKLGGRIAVESAVGKGTKVRVSLPLAGTQAISPGRIENGGETQTAGTGAGDAQALQTNSMASQMDAAFGAGATQAPTM